MKLTAKYILLAEFLDEVPEVQRGYCGGGEIPSFSLLVLLTGLIIKLIWDRLTGKKITKFIMCVHGRVLQEHETWGLIANGAVEAYMPSWAKEKGAVGGLWLQKRGRKFTWGWRSKGLVISVCWAIFSNGAQRGLWSNGPCSGSSLPVTPVYIKL